MPPACTSLHQPAPGGRWPVLDFIEQAREEGATWQQIGDALEVSRQPAWEWYKRNIELEEAHVARFHDAGRGRTALGSPDQ